MQWIAPAEKDSATTTLEKRLWDAVDQFRANSELTAHMGIDAAQESARNATVPSLDKSLTEKVQDTRNSGTK